MGPAAPGSASKGNVMHSARSLAALAALSGLLLLSGCGAIDDLTGGDDGDDGGGDVVAMPDSPPSSIAGVVSDEPDLARDEAAKAATALPEFGSVTQSSNVTIDGESRITAETASATFDAGEIRLVIKRPGRSRLSFDSAAEESESTDFDPLVPGYSGRLDALVNPTDRGIAVAVVATRWNDADPTDYLAGGYWASIEFHPDAENFSGLASVGVGTFADGPDLRGTPALPGTGRATYEGRASGLYGYRYGDRHGATPSGSTAIGQFAGVASLTANFAAGTIDGCIGCTGGMTVAAFGTTPEGEEFETVDESMPARIDLGPAAIDAAGTFRNETVRVRIDGRAIAASAGAWGGRFSDIADAAGDPRLAAGTAGAEWTETDGGQGVFLGAWFADKR